MVSMAAYNLPNQEANVAAICLGLDNQIRQRHV